MCLPRNFSVFQETAPASTTTICTAIPSVIHERGVRRHVLLDCAYERSGRGARKSQGFNPVPPPENPFHDGRGADRVSELFRRLGSELPAQGFDECSEHQEQSD